MKIHYYWQGNVRQLKNVAQQISLIEERREITSDILAHYLPAHQMHRGLALAGQTQPNAPMEELKMLYNMIGMMKREIDMLKTELGQLQNGHNISTQVEDEFVEWKEDKVLGPTNVSVVSEVVPEVIEESPKELKLTDMERETIRKSLINNSGNRKATAAELGLSERTLYRKIKEYGL